MKIDDILAEWEKDAVIDRHELATEAIRIAKLHSKYYGWFVQERLQLIALENRMRPLRLEKHEFFTQGPSKEQIEKGWRLPPRGAVLIKDAPMYIDADPEIAELAAKISIAREKVNLLDGCIKALKDRGYNIRAAVDFIRFTSGA